MRNVKRHGLTNKGIVECILAIGKLRDLDYAIISNTATPMEDGSYQFICVSNHKVKLSKVLNITVGTINTAIQDLYKRDIIRRICNGYYIVNPMYFWHGNLKGRRDGYIKYLKVEGSGGGVDFRPLFKQKIMK